MRSHHVFPYDLSVVRCCSIASRSRGGAVIVINVGVGEVEIEWHVNGYVV